MDTRRQSGLWAPDPSSGYYQQSATQAGPYQYYRHPSDADKRRSFSDRSGDAAPPTSNGLGIGRADSQRIRELTRAASEKVTAPNLGHPQSRSGLVLGGTTADEFTQTTHVNSTRLRGSADQAPLRVKTGAIHPDAVPANVRSKAWSPELISPNTQRPRRASETTDFVRQGSVPERSPLQKLEGKLDGISKEEKRARIQVLEEHARRRSASGKAGGIEGENTLGRSGTLRSEKGRVVSDGSRRPSESISDRKYKNSPKEVYVPSRGADSRGTRGQALPSIATAPRPYHHAPITPRDLGAAQYSPSTETRPHNDAPVRKESVRRNGPAEVIRDDSQQRNSVELTRTVSGKYKHRLRDAGFAGAAAAVAGAGAAASHHASAAERGKAAYERRKSQDPQSADVNEGSLSRADSRKLQKRLPPDAANGGDRKDSAAAAQDQRRSRREQNVNEISTQQQQQPEKHHHLGGVFHRHDHPERPSRATKTKGLDEWRNAPIAALAAAELDLDATNAGAKDNTWWEKDGSRRRSSSAANATPTQLDGAYEEEAKVFRPQLFLKCGPLLRYTGLRRQAGSRGEKEIWRGSVMIVTEDTQSDYSTPPMLRLFAQSADLHQPPSREMLASGAAIPPEFEDPVAGQVKVSRTGRPLYVRPVHDLEGDIDLSREENNHGLYAATRTPLLGPQFSSQPEGRQSAHITFQDKSRIKRRDGEKLGRFRDVRAIRLHTERGLTFWRWSLEIELGSTQHRVAYRINRGPALGFWVPGGGETMNMMFHSCNGFSLSIDPNNFSGPDPLWRDVLNRHQSRPFHVMIGGGDQIYNDAAMRDTTHFRDWLRMKNPDEKHHAEFSQSMHEELESFYLQRYAMWFSQGLFAMAASQIPMVNLWDDHDIIDGYGSYPDHFMSTNVFRGLGGVAFKYYMLFQHQSLPAETTQEEPSWILGAQPGPYIAERSRSLFLHFGRHVAFLGLDCRTERRRDEILSEPSYHAIFERCMHEIREGETKHLIVLLGVPIAYPRLNFLENILTSRVMDPIKALGRTGALGGFVNKFDGGVEILDDLDDHWTAKHHKAERNWFIQELQELAAEKSVRVTILGGDVHLGAVGQFYTPRKFHVSKDKDHRYMPNVISSAIVNTPPPTMMADVLNRRNKVHHLDPETDEDLIPMFEVDVDGSKRKNRCLLPRRNYATLREFAPGHTPPPSPRPERWQQGSGRNSVDGVDGGNFDSETVDSQDRRFPPGSMRRTMSLTRGGARLIRRLSGSSRSKNPPLSLRQQESGGPFGNNTPPATAPGMGRSQSLSSATRPGSASAGGFDGSTAPQRPTHTFHRRPTNLSEKEIRRAAARGGAPDEGDEDGEAGAGGAALPPLGHINLEGGLDISLNMEIDQHDPSGATVPYRLLVPALWYSGDGDANTSRFQTRRKGFLDRLRGTHRDRGQVDGQDEYSDEEDEGSRTPSPPPTQQQQPQQPVQQRRPSLKERMGLAWSGPRRDREEENHGHDGQMDQRAEAGLRGSMDPRSGDGGRGGGAAYGKGYTLSSPPIGPYAAQQQQKQQQPPTSRLMGVNANSPNRPVGSEGANIQGSVPARAGDPVHPRTAHAREQEEYSDVTPSDDLDDWPQKPNGGDGGGGRRRLSKAERFFGIGDGDAAQPPPGGGAASGGGWRRRLAGLGGGQRGMRDDDGYDGPEDEDSYGEEEEEYEDDEEPEKRSRWKIWK